MAISVSPRTRVGARLREARRERGVTLDEAARETRIKPRFLEALESDAPPSAFRAPVYARAFLREYARFLRLDPEPLVREYAEAHTAARPAPIAVWPPPRRRRRIGRWLGLLAALVWFAVLASLAVMASLEGEAPSTTVPSEAERGYAPPPAGPDRVVLRLRVVDRRTWLSVIVDDARAARGRVPRGWARTFEAGERIEIEVADAGAVRLSLNGEDLGRPGEEGITYRAAFVLRRGEVEVLEPEL